MRFTRHLGVFYESKPTKNLPAIESANCSRLFGCVLRHERLSKEITMFPGKMVVPGIAVGEALLWSPTPIVIANESIAAERIESEKIHFERALQSAQRELSDVAQRINSSVGNGAAGIFAAHIRILEDPQIVQSVEQTIAQDMVSAATAIQIVIDRHAKRLTDIGDEYFAARAEDLHDLGRRLQRHLRKQEPPQLPHLKTQAILIVESLSAAEVIALDRKNLLGLVMTQTGPTSHAALLASTFGIPVLARVDSLWGRVQSGETVILDANAGGIIVKPSALALRQYRTRRELFEVFSGEVAGLRDLPATTPDGRTIRLTANLGLSEEVANALAQGADGLGLVRTEYFYLAHDKIPSEVEQYEFYRDIVSRMAPKPVTFRTFDLGGDKTTRRHDPEENPMLGCRGIRLLLDEYEMFKSQLRALLRASTAGCMRIMFPLITSLTEFQDTMRVVAEVKHELTRQQIAFDPHISFGCMMETPAAATIPDLLAQEVEFFSIGSNDLIQYTLAADRTNPRVTHIYEPLHLAVLRMMRGIVRAAHRRNRSVSLCGEMAADPIYSIILLGLGVDELSVNPVMIPAIKQIIRNVSWADARQIAREILTQARAKDVQTYLEAMMSSRFPKVMSFYSHSDTHPASGA
jgi:phosphoenolpyruvate-protein phosphotransferase (PTS system enzyme I)